MSKKNILYRFSMALMFMCLFYSCMQKEESENSLAGIVEFVARPTNYNGQNVGTKATSVSDFENKIHNCYFLLFNNDGIRTFISEDLGNTLTTQRFSKQQLQQFGGGDLDSYTNSTACFIANVPKAVVEGIKTLEQLNGMVLDIAYSSADVIDTEESNKNSFFVVPEFDLDNDENTPSVQCIPMLGMTTPNHCNLKTTDLFPISLKRLFAKISVNLSVTQTSSSFDLLSAHLYNLPTKVKLTEPTAPASYESLWVKDASAFTQTQIESAIGDDNISAVVDGSYKFYFYAPEYFLQPLDSTTTKEYGNEKYKPRMYDADKLPVFVRLFGTYKESITSSNKTDVKYDLYLGENASTNFSLRRNMHYINYVKINGIVNSIDGDEEEETLDCRVQITTHNMVELYGQTANCYVLGAIGTYSFPACKGVYKGDMDNIPESQKCTKGTTLEILAQDNTSIKLENLTYIPESEEFSFDITTLDGGFGLLASNDGNVILGLTYVDENGVKQTEWSWHIWVCSGSEYLNDTYQITTQPYPNGAWLMDRNLGANTTTLANPGAAVGLYYRYGQREPFIEDKRTGLSSTNKSDYYGYNNTKVDWSGTDKAQTDPCPPGYRVPARSVWEHTSSPVALHNSTIGAFEYWDDVYYPYSGYLNGSNTLVNNFTPPYTHSDTYTDEISYLGTRYKNIKYTMTVKYSAGTLLGTDKTFVYEGSDQGVLSDMTIISCERYTYHFSFSGSYYSWDAYTPSGVLANVLVNGVKTQIESTLTDIMRKLNRIDPDPSYGYQVRCVKE